MRLGLLLRILGIVGVAAGPAGALGAQVEHYQEGNRLYQQGDFEGAVASYQRVVDSGMVSGEVYYNLGNSFFKLGELAPAILNYERARRLLPGDEDVRANLALARSLTVDEIEPLPRFWVLDVWSWWVDLLPRSLLIALVALSYLVAVGGAILLVTKRGTSFARWGGRLAIGGGAVVLVLGLNLTIRELQLGQPEEAIVIAPRVDVSSAPIDDQALTVFTVHEGTKVRVDRRAEEWAEVVLEDGRVGWIRVGALETI